MMEDELKKVYDETGCTDPIIWIDRGYHNTPNILRNKLQQIIDELKDNDIILLTFGLCGNALQGILSKQAKLVLPRFDDCINLLLYTEKKKRKERALAKAGSIYVTRGWTLEPESILAQYEQNIEKYGYETAKIVIEMMYENYKEIRLINTGCYDIKPVEEYVKKAAELTNLSTSYTEGSSIILKQLILEQWDNNFIIQEAGIELDACQWEML
ncbi:DUF1638 domain-containing protein [Lachnospiraceae bacterium ZAX-1]